MSLTQKPESGLKLADVVKFASYAQPWHKVDDDSRFGEFHVRFWGKSMIDEEREWLNLKTQSLNHPTDDDNDVILENRDDLGTDADGDDEFIPGCYELDVGPNPVSDVSRIWIRADYIRIFNYTESAYDLCYDRHKAQAVVYTGQPGIGECDCLQLQDTLLIVIKARLCLYCMYYVGVAPKRNRSYGMMDLRVIFLLTMAFTKWPPIFTSTNLRSSYGPWSTLTRPGTASHQILFGIVLVSLLFTLPLPTSPLETTS
jgi:hypothetical protein